MTSWRVPSVGHPSSPLLHQLVIMSAALGDVLFPNAGVRILSAFIHFAGVSILAHCLSRRVAVEQLSSISGLMQLSLARLLILVVMADSWLFLFTGGMVIFGAGLDSSEGICSLGMLLCIIFYATSKALIYAFLVEKMHIVWAPIAGSRRMKSPVYLFSLCILAGYGAIIVLLFVGRISHFRHEDGFCVIGLQHLASIPLIAYDLFTNIVLTGLFLYPLWRNTHLNQQVKRIALRTTLAALVALITSTVNMLILTLMHGEELGWVCLGSCSADVIVNALALFWVTTGSSDDVAHSRSDGLPPRAPSGKTATVAVFRPPVTQRSSVALAGTVMSEDRSRAEGRIAFISGDTLSGGDQKMSPSPPTSPDVPLTPTTPSRSLLRSASTRDPASRSGVSRFLGMFHTSNEEQQQHELQITITRDVQTDFAREPEDTDSSDPEKHYVRHSFNAV